MNHSGTRLMTLLLLVTSLLGAGETKAQNFETVDQQLLWLGAQIKMNLPAQWSLALKIEERRFVFPDRKQQRVLPDLSVSKKLNSNWSAKTGLFVFSIYQPGTPFQEVEETVHEWRPYVNLSRSFPLKNSSIQVSLKSELRLFKDPSSENHFDEKFRRYNLRERLLISWEKNLGEGFKLSIGEEIHFNVASNQEFRIFEQHRIMASLTSKLRPNLDLSTGYLHWFQPTGQTATYFSRNIISLGLTYKVDLKE